MKRRLSMVETASVIQDRLNGCRKVVSSIERIGSQGVLCAVELGEHIAGSLCSALGSERAIVLLGSRVNGTFRPSRQHSFIPAELGKRIDNGFEMPVVDIRVIQSVDGPVRQLVTEAQFSCIADLAQSIDQKFVTFCWLPIRIKGGLLGGILLLGLSESLVHDDYMWELAPAMKTLQLLVRVVLSRTGEMKELLGTPRLVDEGMVLSVSDDHGTVRLRPQVGEPFETNIPLHLLQSAGAERPGSLITNSVWYFGSRTVMSIERVGDIVLTEDDVPEITDEIWQEIEGFERQR